MRPATPLPALLALLLTPLPAAAHMMSMSTGDAVVTGNHLQYFLRIPAYEAPHPSLLLSHIHFSSDGAPARLLQQSCLPDAQNQNYLCAAYYEFPRPVTTLDVSCDLFRVTVPNHVHLLRAENGSRADQAVFDYTFTRATLRFRPPTVLETALREALAGALRAASGLIQLLFLAALALAARSRRELALLALMFLLGQSAGAFLPLQPAPRFVESAAALTVAYLAVEILFLPEAGLRWLIAAALGIVHGLYFALFLRESGYSPAYVLPGAALAELALLALLGALSLKIPRWRPVPAACLLLTGLVWFAVRLRAG